MRAPAPAVAFGAYVPRVHRSAMPVRVSAVVNNGTTIVRSPEDSSLAAFRNGFIGCVRVGAVARRTSLVCRFAATRAAPLGGASNGRYTPSTRCARSPPHARSTYHDNKTHFASAPSDAMKI
ncbi:hypothetical protein DR62_07380 [Burkholderia thailandensis]|nr:hypothetical protein DR62_07380 [Burkholderia thailandensis]AOI54863.1 hypothetical protein WI24_23960 [Burkholderia thailandensis]AOJ53703.1 hypothetical protein AQ475_23080 [Burkholderia thailandensis]